MSTSHFGHMGHHDETAALLLHQPEILTYVAGRVQRNTRMEKLVGSAIKPDENSRMLSKWLTRASVGKRALLAMKPAAVVTLLKRQEQCEAELKQRLTDSQMAYQREERARTSHGGGRFSQHVSRLLCVDCRGVNNHTFDCKKDAERQFNLPVAARVPRRDASTMRWKQFARAMQSLGCIRISEAILQKS